MKLLFIAALCVAVSALAQTSTPKPKLGRKPVDAYRVIGNIYYVGATDVSSHLIVTSQGLILLDTGTLEMHSIIRANIEKLGHRPSDVKIILASHAHWDHVEGHAAMQELTGAKVIGMGEDATALPPGLTYPPPGSSNADGNLSTGHPSAYGMAKKLKLLQEGSATNPFIDPDGYRRAVNGAEARYLKQLAAEKSAQQRR